MSAFRIFTITLLFSLLNAPLIFSVDPEDSPSPAPEPGADGPSPSPSPSPSIHSPPAPPPDSPAPAPAANATQKSPSPAPGHQVASDISHENMSDEKDNGDGGMSGGQKAGVAIGVIAGVFIVGAGAVIYKKRQSNMQRAQFGYDARREIL